MRALGCGCGLSKSTVSRVCEAIKDEFDTWRTRSLAEVELEYLYLDASHFRMHQGARAEPVLVAWGITTDGKPVLLALDGAGAESTDAGLEFLRVLVARGLRPPLLVITDGAPGLIAAVEQVLPHSLRQRCLIHRARNTLAKVSAADQDAVKADYWQLFDDIDAEPGERALAEARRRAEAFADRWGARYPGAVACVLETLPELTTHLRFPREHWGRIRHSNLIERTFGETRRRVKVIGRLPGERSCLSLVWAVLDRARGAGAAWTIGPPTCGCCSSCVASCWSRPHSNAGKVMCWLSPSAPPQDLSRAAWLAAVSPTPDIAASRSDLLECASEAGAKEARHEPGVRDRCDRQE
jgi:putative transposase